jgi:hypothetical protein
MTPIDLVVTGELVAHRAVVVVLFPEVANYMLSLFAFI